MINCLYVVYYSNQTSKVLHSPKRLKTTCHVRLQIYPLKRKHYIKRRFFFRFQAAGIKFFHETMEFIPFRCTSAAAYESAVVKSTILMQCAGASNFSDIRKFCQDCLLKAAVGGAVPSEATYRQRANQNRKERMFL